MKYLMQILLGLILLQLLQSCDYSKSRDVLWMKKNFENNAELFFDVTNLFNNSGLSRLLKLSTTTSNIPQTRNVRSYTGFSAHGQARVLNSMCQSSGIRLTD